MKKMLFGKVAVTASTIRRAATVAIVLSLGTGVSAVILTKPFSDKQKEVINNPIISNQTHEEHFNDINLEDLDKENEVKPVIKTDHEEYNWNIQEETHQETSGGGGDNPSPSPTPGPTPSQYTCPTPSAPTVNGPFTYDGQAHQLTGEAGVDPEYTVYYAVNESNTTQPLGTEFTLTVPPSKTDIGEYYVWYKAKRDGYNDSSISHVGPISIVDPNPPAPTKEPGRITAAPTKADDTEYTGNSIPLLNTPGTTDTGTMMYCVTNNTNIPNKSSFSEGIPERIEKAKYYVWYYSKGNATHEDTEITSTSYVGPIEIKAPTVTKLQPTITKTPEKVSNNLSYTGSNQTLVIAGESSDGTFKYCLKTTESARPTTSEYGDSLPQAKDAGTYYVWYYLKGDATHYDSTPGSIEITISADQASFITKPSIATGYLYNAGPQDLVLDAGEANTGIVKFAVKKDTDVQPALNEFTVSLPQATEPGKYYVWYLAGGNANYGDSAPEYKTVSIRNDKAIVTQAPTPNTTNNVFANVGVKVAIHNDDGQATGSSDFMYALSASSTVAPIADAYTPEIVEVDEPGTYYVWYYAKGDSTHLDSDKAWIKCELKKKQLTFSVIVSPNSLTYDETKQELVSISGLSILEGSEAGDLVFYVSSTDITSQLTDTYNAQGNFGSYSDSFKSLTEDSEVLKKTEPGTYYVYYYAKGKGNYLDSINITNFYKVATIANNPTTPAPVLTAPTASNATDFEAPNFIGYAQLISSAATYSDGTNSFPVYYAYSKTNVQPDTNTFLTYTNPVTQLIVNEPGLYYVWFYGKKADGSISEVNSITSKIKGRPSFIQLPQVITSPESNGAFLLEQPGTPITPGITDDGTIMYSLVKSSDPAPNISTYSADLPIVSQPGEYTLRYFIKGNDLHCDTSDDLNTVTVYVKKKLSLLTQPALKDSIVNGTCEFDVDAAETVILKTLGVASDEASVYYYVANEDQITLSAQLESYKTLASPITNINDLKISSSGTFYLLYFARNINNESYIDSDIKSIKFTVERPFAHFIDGQEPVLAVDPMECDQTDPSQGFEHTDLLTNGGHGVTRAKYTWTTDNVAPSLDSFYYGEDNIPSVLTAGTYYVWYTFDENIFYRQPEPQLLGTVTVQQNPVNLPVVDYTTPIAATNLIYDGTPQNLLSSLGESSNGEILYTVSTSINYNGNFSYSTPKATNAGTYYVYFQAYPLNSRTHRAMGTPGFVIATIAKKDQNINVDIKVKENLIAPKPNENPISLIEREPTSTYNTPAEYYVSKANVAPTEDSQWVSASNVKEKEAGLYYIWYRCAGTTNYNPTPIRQTTAIIKGDCPVGCEPTINASFSGTLADGILGRYNAQQQTPINKGSSDYGTMMFAKANTSTAPALTEFSEEVPTIKEVGDYYYFYYVKSNSPLYHDTDVKSIHVVMDKGIVTITTPVTVDNAINIDNTGSRTVYSVAYTGSPVSISGECTSGGVIKVIAATTLQIENNPLYYLNPANYTPLDDYNFSDIKNYEEKGYKFSYYLDVTDTDNYIVDSNYNSSKIEDNLSELYILKTEHAEIGNDPVGIDLATPPAVATALCSPAILAKGDKVYYAVSDTLVDIPTSSNAYSESIPERKEPGTYYVYYYAVGDNYLPSEVKYITATINGTQEYTVTFKSNLTAQLKQDGSGALDEVHIVESASPGVTWYYRVGDGPKTTGATDLDPTVTRPGTYCVTYYYTDSSYTSDYRTTYINVGFGDTLLYTPTPATGIVKYSDDAPLINTYAATFGSDDPNYILMYSVTDTEVEPNSTAYSASGYRALKAGVQYLWWRTNFYEGGVSPLGPYHFAVNVVKGTPEFENGEGPQFPSSYQILPDGIAKMHYYGIEQNVFEPESLKIKDQNAGLKLMFYVSKDGANNNPDKGLYTETVPTVLNPGQYTIYYYIKGNENYEDSPVRSKTVGVYEDIPSYSSEPSAAYKDYAGTSLQLIEAGQAYQPFKMMYAVGSASSAPALSSFSETIPTAVNAGTYYVWWYVAAPDGRVVVQPRKVNVNPQHGTHATINKRAKEIEDPVFISSGTKEANGDQISLIKTLPSNLDGRIIKYYIYNLADLPDYARDNLDNYLDNQVYIQQSNFITDLPTVNSPGTYVVYYYSPESTNYFEYGYSERLHSEKITINSSSSIILPKKKNLICNGTEQELIIKGEIDESLGEFYYGIGYSDSQPPMDTNYSTSVPKASGQGIYYVYYKIKYLDNTFSRDEYVITIMNKRASVVNVAPEPNYDDIGSTTLLQEPHYRIKWDDQEHDLIKSTNPGSSVNDGKILYYLTDKFPHSYDDFDADFTSSGGGSMGTLMLAAQLSFNPDYYDFVHGLLVGSGLLQEAQFGALFANSFAFPHAKDPGIYTVYYTAVPDNYWATLLGSGASCDVDPLIHDVDNNNNSLHTIIIEIYQDKCIVDTAPTKANGGNEIPFTGSPVDLVNEGVGAKPDGTPDNNIKMKYYVSRQLIDDPSTLDRSAFSEGIPQGVNAGSYYVYFFADGGSEYEDSDIGGIGPITISNVGAPEITQALEINTPCPLNLDVVMGFSGDNEAMQRFITTELISKMPEGTYQSTPGTAKLLITDASVATADTSSFNGPLTVTAPLFPFVGSYKMWYYLDFGGGVATVPEYVAFELVKGVADVVPPSTLPADELYVTPTALPKLFFKKGDFMGTGRESMIGDVYYHLDIYQEGQTPSETAPAYNFTGNNEWDRWRDYNALDLFGYSGNTPAKLRLWYFVKVDTAPMDMDGGVTIRLSDFFANTEPAYVDADITLKLPYDPAGTNVTPPTFASGTVQSTTGGVALASGGSADRGWHFVYGISQSEGVAPTNLTSTTVPKIADEGEYWVYAAEVCDSAELGYYPTNFWRSEKITVVRGKASIKAIPAKPENLGYQFGALMRLVDLDELYGDNKNNYLHENTSVKFYVTDDITKIPNPSVDTFASAIPGINDSAVCRSEKGTYYVWAIVEDDTGKNLPSDPFMFYPVEITNPIASITKVPRVGGKVSGNDPTTINLLMEDGEADYGTIMYYVSRSRKLPEDFDKSLFKPYSATAPLYPVSESLGDCYIHVYVKSSDPNLYNDSPIDPKGVLDNRGQPFELPMWSLVTGESGVGIKYVYPADSRQLVTYFEFDGTDQRVMNTEFVYCEGNEVKINEKHNGEGITIKYGISHAKDIVPDEYFTNFMDVTVKDPVPTDAPYYLHIRVEDINSPYDVLFDTTDSAYQTSAIPIYVVGQSISYDTRPSAKSGSDMYYTGSPIQLINYGSCSKGTIKYFVTEDPTYRPNDSDFTLTEVKKTDPATYYVWFKAFANEVGYADTASEKLVATITPDYDVGVMPKALYVPVEASTGKYKLISPGIKTGYTFEYAIMPEVVTMPFVDPGQKNTLISQMSQDIPVVLQGEYQTYTYFWRMKADGDSDWGDLNVIYADYVNPDLDFDRPIFVDSITYSDNQQLPLCSAPLNLQSGKIMYASSDNPAFNPSNIISNYSDSIPTASAIGKYYVRYIWVNDAEDTILAGPYAKEVSITKAKVQLIMDGVEVSDIEYSGSPVKLSQAFTAATPSKGGGANQVCYMVSDSEPTIEYTPGGELIGEWYYSPEDVSFNEAGTYTVWIFASKPQQSEEFDDSDMVSITVNVIELPEPTVTTEPVFNSKLVKDTVPTVEYNDIKDLDLLITPGEVENGTMYYALKRLTLKTNKKTEFENALASGDPAVIKEKVDSLVCGPGKDITKEGTYFRSLTEDPNITKFSSAEVQALATSGTECYEYFGIMYGAVGDPGFKNLDTAGYIIKVHFPGSN